MKAVIFDVGRVLVHWESSVVLAGLSSISQASEQEILALLDAESSAIGRGELDSFALHAYLVAQAGTDPDWQRFFVAFCNGLCRNDPVLALASRLQRREDVQVGVISNTNEVHGRWLHEHIPEFRDFGTVILSSEVGLLKPEAAIYQLALAQLQVAPAQALFVDDLESNVAGAEAVGMAGLVYRDCDQAEQAVAAWLDHG